ncbi:MULTISPECIES: class I adenylate-forming enzyme family protein [unclassified Sphingobium]|uniref:class I adenylate-forming enzyme family protein n=1 Tax=unclassified Sphingobium TaxID=2611147 RepID=UPI000D167AB9|nr:MULTISPECIES: AMP-binding protein [unclassified Sphingobium]MBG6116395.1 acyl-CoA synthetase (AMP-forming)/AMP-acid ligase II [Sphingobium sp. JAI105]PSO09639.1 long-chain fatty acid--CoA ligase [Sphingobium sp. AEW4]TWC97406.1 acyl-CoA synthetase (AMP-forming)/AMP-acid ligase II [Sphingobium sp. AEW010]TWD17782.1 acyl-CoA synthetase (AMP-forming)/AMP-acid ligase II [Sphingobium sp. AEW013]TWD20022.1 acyl-CoA synthetase (AMP-forming)/AMP-acid ligase II [Sphingobium sp. AEW001]
MGSTQAINWDEAKDFGDVITMAAEVFGEKIAFRDRHRDISFSEFRAEANAIAAALIEQGLVAGDRVAILALGRIESAVLLALCTAGLIPVPLNSRLSSAELARLVQDCKPRALFYESAFQESIAAIEEEFVDGPRMFVIDPHDASPGSYAGLVNLGAGVAPAGDPSGDDPCCLLYTSGTTGAPKGVLLPHAGAVANCRDIARAAFDFTPDDVTLMAMPLFHVGGIWYYMFPSFASGCTTIIRERFDPDDVVASMAAEGVTNIHIVPTMLGDILTRPMLAEAAAKLRLIVYAGSSMPSDLLHRAMQALPACEFAQAYGSTEGGTITALSPSDHRKAVMDPVWAHLLRSCGRPIGDVEIRIEPEDDRSSEPLGEILIHSSKLMTGYWQRPEATAEKLIDGWLQTGDVGHIDKHGYLYIVDRKNDMIISGGENVFPFEVEEVLCSHPAVAEAAVFGVADPRWVERLVGAVVLHSAQVAEPAEIIAFARQRLAGYKTPKSLLILPSLPRNAVGKILRKELRLEYADLI